LAVASLATDVERCSLELEVDEFFIGLPK
jgi:hypothetical protein